MKKRTSAEFIEELKEIYGDTYIYDKTIYTGYEGKVIITCKKHGDFSTGPRNALSGQACSKCAHNAKTTEEFKELAYKIHGKRYDYSLVDYKNIDDKIIIICNKHGKFEQSAYNHLHGANCQYCVGTAKLNTEEFKRRAQAKHGDEYIYTESVYKGAKEKIVITCRKHGNFLQIPYEHVSGKGCKLCGLEKLCGIPIDSPEVYERFKTYKRIAHRLTNKEYKKFEKIINPNNLNRSKTEYHIDHMYSLKSGFINEVPLNIISSYVNLEIIYCVNNSAKGYKNSQTLEELYERYKRKDE